MLCTYLLLQFASVSASQDFDNTVEKIQLLSRWEKLLLVPIWHDDPANIRDLIKEGFPGASIFMIFSLLRAVGQYMSRGAISCI